MLFLVSSCNICIEGTGPEKEVTVDLEAFTELEVDVNADVLVRMGETPSLTISAQENLLDIITTEVTSQRLTIEADPCVSSAYPIKIDVVTNALNSVHINGSADVTILDEIYADEVDIKINGSGNVTADVFTNDLSIKINGSGDVMLSGAAESAGIGINGSGDVKAMDLQAYEANVKVNGSGNTRINVLNSLRVNVKGSGDVKYSGNPSVKTSITGSGSVTKID
jgi:hypothetical protein